MPLTRRDFVRTLFAASQTALVGRLLTTRLHAEEIFSGALNFAVIGDWGRHGRPDQTQVAQQMAVACQNASASFVISVGDNFYENGVASVDDPHWQKSFEKVYAAASLQVPWYVILGNHDYLGSCEAQFDYGKTHPRWIMPARYYSQIHPLDAATQAEFFYIDTSPFIAEYQHAYEMKEIPAQDTAAQLDWLDRSLAASTAQWKIVHGHHPIYSTGSGHGNQPDMIRLVLPILQKNKVQAYFCGHDHDLEHLKADDLNLFVSGGGSEHRPVLAPEGTPFSQGISGFAMASLRPHDMQVRMIDNLGNLLYTATVSRSG